MEEKVREVNKMLEDLGESFRIEYRIVYKNNEVLDGVMITSDRDICPTIYVDTSEFIDTPNEKIVDSLRQVISSCNMEIDRDYLTKSYILANVYPRLVGKSNLSWVREGNYVYKKFLDMLILFYVRLGDKDGNMVSYTLLKSHVRGLKTNDIYGAALSNLKSQTDVFPMEQVINEMLGCDLSFGGAWILTNKWRINGAAVILLPDLLSDISEMYGEDFVVMPSSIHEVITAPIGLICNVEQIYEMVCTVNTETIEPRDLLTNNVYIYDGALRAYK